MEYGGIVVTNTLLLSFLGNWQTSDKVSDQKLSIHALHGYLMNS